MTPADELQLQQLLQMQFWLRQHPEEAQEEAAAEKASEVSLPGQWVLTRDLTLHSWQTRCVDSWFSSGKRGVIKVVTGAGKTVLALAIAERLQRTEMPDLRVVIIVPTVVLLDQWREELLTRSNLPASAIGRMGGGHDDVFDAKTRILICVLNSAAKKLPALVRDCGVGDSLLLVVDECHRAGAAEMQKIFHTARVCSLGLSATPERVDDVKEEDESGDNLLPEEFETTVLGQELGPVIFELNYAEAIELGVLPPFSIVHYGLSLKPHESLKYERVSHEIKEVRKSLERPGRQGLALIRWCRSKGAAGNPSASRLIGLSSERKRLLFQMEERANAVMRLLREAFAENPDTKAILFHESIEEVMRLFFLLRSEGFPVVAEHSEFPDSMRSSSLHLFRQGAARIIVSARSLIEGFNVPSADLGIIVAATSSVRQRVQTLGRLLRKSKEKDGSEKHAVLHVLYASQTVDEMIYEKADWERFVGAERNQYFLWPDVGQGEPQPKAKAPRCPSPVELAVEEAALKQGEIYPGDTNEGLAYTRDSQGTIRGEDGRLIEPHGELIKVLKYSRKSAGRFRVTPSKLYVIELEKTGEGWQGVYLGRLSCPIAFVEEEEGSSAERDWKPGDSYPLSRVCGLTFSVLQRDPRLIAKKQPGGVRFVLPLNQIAEPEKRAALSRIQAFLKLSYGKGHQISKVTVTKEGHVVYVFHNQGFFAGHAPEGAQGFSLEL